jgi:predicted DNA repair protein MutK
MATGLLALLDDIAGIAKVAAASIDDVLGQAAKAGVKAAGVVIDDAAVTPKYVVGFAADRELPIVWKIALGSLRNKLLILLPLALLLSTLAPWSITPLLMLGGLFLCYEGAEKVYETFWPHQAHHHEAVVRPAADAKELETQKVAGAIKTDFILSAEIMALTLATIEGDNLFLTAVVLAVVGIGITVVVYGAVAIIVKADDVGVSLAREDRSAGLRSLGRTIVAGMPVLLQGLSIVGTAAMIWVGGGIVVHGLEEFGWHLPADLIHDAAASVGSALSGIAGLAEWIVSALLNLLVGLVLGFLLIPTVQYGIAPAWQVARGLFGRGAPAH